MIRVCTISEAGGHAKNEDAFEVRSHSHDKECYLCALADGQGGQPGGRLAAKLACCVCLDAALTYPPPVLLFPATWTNILHKVDKAVSDNAAAGFTTLVAFGIAEGHLFGASCGDSAAVLLDSRKPSEILTARQNKNPPVGSGAATFDHFVARLTPPWIVLTMSDGVWKYAGWDSILKIGPQTQGEEIIASLRRSAGLPRSGGLQDDFTLVVLQDA